MSTLAPRCQRLPVSWIAALLAVAVPATAQPTVEVAPATPPALTSPAAAPALGASVGARSAEVAEWIPERERIWLGHTAPPETPSAAPTPAEPTTTPTDEPTAEAAADQPAAEPFFARQQRNLSGTPRGSVLIVPDAGQHAAWPDIVAALFDQLPLHGWHTLAPALPPPAVQAVSVTPAVQAASAAAEAGTTEPDTLAATAEPVTTPAPPVTDNGETTAPLPDAIAQQRLQVALQHLNQNGDTGTVIAIGIGHGALRAARLVAAAPQTFAGLVLINANGAADPEFELTPLLAALELPTLELLTAPSATDRQQAAARARQLNAHGQFAQVLLPVPAATVPAMELRYDNVARRVRGWLDRQSASR